MQRRAEASRLSAQRAPDCNSLTGGSPFCLCASRSSSPCLCVTQVVNLQVEHGLLQLKRTCNWMEALLRASEYAGDGRKQTADLQNRWNDSGEVLHDEMAAFVHGCTMLQEVVMHTYLSNENFRKSALNDVVIPLYAFYKSAQARRREVTKEHSKMQSGWRSIEESLAKERRDCQRFYSELRIAQDLKDKEEQSETSDASLFPKLVKKWQAARETCMKRFSAFEKSWEKAKAIQETNENVTLPAMLSELEALERERLKLMTEYTQRFQALFQTWSADMKSSALLIEKVAPALQGDKCMSMLFDKWIPRFGSPPALQPVRYDLPCNAAAIGLDVMPPENAPLLAAVAINSSTPFSGASPAAATSPSASSASAASRAITPGPSAAAGGTAQPAYLGSGSYPMPAARKTPAPLPKAAVPQSVARPLPTAVVKSSPPPPAAGADGSAAAASSTAAAAAPAAGGAVRMPLPKLGKARAPPPSLPQKRKPKAPGEPGDADISVDDLPPPPMPPPVTAASGAYRMSISHPRSSVAGAAAAAAAAAAASAASSTDAAASGTAAAAAAEPAPRAASKRPPPLPGAATTAAVVPPPLPVAAIDDSAAAALSSASSDPQDSPVLVSPADNTVDDSPAPQATPDPVAAAAAAQAQAESDFAAAVDAQSSAGGSAEADASAQPSAVGDAAADGASASAAAEDAEDDGPSYAATALFDFTLNEDTPSALAPHRPTHAHAERPP